MSQTAREILDQRTANLENRHDEILDFINERPPAVYSTEVADLLDVHRETANRHLRKLREKGEVEYRQPVGNAPKMWYTVE